MNIFWSVKEGTGVIINGRNGKSPPLASREDFGDARIHVEFIDTEKLELRRVPPGPNMRFRYSTVGPMPTSRIPAANAAGYTLAWDETRPGKSYDGHSALVNASPPPRTVGKPMILSFVRPGLIAKAKKNRQRKK